MVNVSRLELNTKQKKRKGKQRTGSKAGCTTQAIYVLVKSIVASSEIAGSC